MRSLGSTYLESLFHGYADGRQLARHLRDVERLWATAHGAGAAVLVVAFPFLNTGVVDGSDLMDLSRRRYIAPLAARFRATCRPGDGLLDVASLIAAQPRAADPAFWVANRMDPHPSSALHALVAGEIVRFVRGEPGGVERCPSRDDVLRPPLLPPS